MLSKQATTAGCLFSELLIAECEKQPDLKCTDQEVGRWFRASPATGARIRDGAFDKDIQDFRHALMTPAAKPLLIALTAGTPWTFTEASGEAVDADRDGDIDKNDVALLGITAAQKGIEKIASITRNAAGKSYTPSAMNELEAAAATATDAINDTIKTARECAMTGPRAVAG